MAASAPGQLGRERDDPRRTGGDPRVDRFEIGVAQVGGVVRARARRGQKRALEVDAERHGASRRAAVDERSQRGLRRRPAVR